VGLEDGSTGILHCLGNQVLISVGRGHEKRSSMATLTGAIMPNEGVMGKASHWGGKKIGEEAGGEGERKMDSGQNTISQRPENRPSSAPQE